jgi:hypothetical protein
MKREEIMKVKEIVKKLKPKFWELIDKTKKEGKECGALICEKSGKIIFQVMPEGEESEMIFGKCKQGKKLGCFHTHPKEEGVASLNLVDASRALEEEITFEIIGTKEKDTKCLTCFVFDTYHPKYKELAEKYLHFTEPIEEWVKEDWKDAHKQLGLITKNLKKSSLDKEAEVKNFVDLMEEVLKKGDELLRRYFTQPAKRILEEAKKKNILSTFYFDGARFTKKDLEIKELSYDDFLCHEKLI